MSCEPLEWTVDAEDEGRRLDQWLSSRIEGPSRSSIKKWIENGQVQVDGSPPQKSGLALRAGMQIRVEPSDAPDSSPRPQQIDLEILHEDASIVVVNKPAGLVVHAGSGNPDGTLVNALLGKRIQLSNTGLPDRPGIVHRLDKGTSGVMVIAKTDAAHAHLSDSFAERKVRKSYRALTWGRPAEPSGEIHKPMGRSRSHPTKMSVTGFRGAPREAISTYRVLEEMPGFAWVQVLPHTGRTHQIRVHMQSIGHPLVGDDTYGGPNWKGLQDPIKRKAVRGLNRLALHAAELEFPHPDTGDPFVMKAPVPNEIEALLSILRVPV